MGAPCTTARRPGTGSVRRAGRFWEAYAPQSRGDRKRMLIGRYETAWHASKACDEWVRKQSEPRGA